MAAHTLPTFAISPREQRAIALLQCKGGRSAATKLLALFTADPGHERDRQAKLAKQAADEHLYAALLATVHDQPHDPEIFRSLCHPRRFANGVVIPGSRFGIDNPDNIYRMATIDPTQRYLLSGHRPTRMPADAGLTLLAGFPGDGRLANSLSFLGYADVPVGADGRFEILLDAEAGANRLDQLNIAGGRVLFFRDTQGDWEAEGRFALTLRCLSAQPAPDGRSDAAILHEAERLATAMAREFLDTLQHKYVEYRPPNIIKSPRPSGDHGGLVSQLGSLGWYSLAQDEALIIDVDPLRARYFGIQIADLWTLSYDYTNAMSSMNAGEATVEPDGRIRFVISARDPQVHNWLDGGGHSTGSITLRWQHADPAAGPNKDTVMSQLVKIANLREALPPETVYVTATQRLDQQMRRAHGWLRRLAGDAEEQGDHA